MNNDNNNIWGKRLGNNTPNNMISPIKFKDTPIKTKPFQPFNQNLNGETKFAITSQTENGKYVRGDVLYFKLNGVEIYAPINSILMIDTVENTVFIKDDKVISDSVSHDAESIHYILLYTDIGFEDTDSEIPFRWESVVGMSKAFTSIIDNATLIDIDKSIVLTEYITPQDALSVREFCEYIKNSEIYKDNEEFDNFDINDYAGSDYI